MRFITWRGLLSVCVAMVALVALVACGDANGNQFSSDVVAQQVVVTADPNGALRWDKQEYTAQAGDVTFVVKNPSQVTHQFSVEGNGVNYKSPNIKPGSTNNYTVKGWLASVYQIVCHYPGQKRAGMVATLIIK